MLPQLLRTFILRQVLSLNLEFTDFAMLAGQAALETIPYQLP